MHVRLLQTVEMSEWVFFDDNLTHMASVFVVILKTMVTIFDPGDLGNGRI